MGNPSSNQHSKRLLGLLFKLEEAIAVDPCVSDRVDTDTARAAASLKCSVQPLRTDLKALGEKSDCVHDDQDSRARRPVFVGQLGHRRML